MICDAFATSLGKNNPHFGYPEFSACPVFHGHFPDLLTNQNGLLEQIQTSFHELSLQLVKGSLFLPVGSLKFIWNNIANYIDTLTCLKNMELFYKSTEYDELVVDYTQMTLRSSFDGSKIMFGNNTGVWSVGFRKKGKLVYDV